jgi:RNA polymerase sigma-70 factor, ECF subfamily
MPSTMSALAVPVRAQPAPALPPFVELYDAHARFVFRALARLGVPDAVLDDAVQDVFLVVHRKSAEFEGRSSARTWLYGIALRVARKYRHLAARATQHDPDVTLSASVPNPEQHSQRIAEVRRVDEILRGLDEPMREVFVLAEIEQLTAPEIAEILEVKLNTVYSRLRLARERFEAALMRDRARERHEVGP